MKFLPLILLFVQPVAAAVLSWNPSPSGNVTGYVVHYESNFPFQSPTSVPVGNVTRTELDFPAGLWFIGVTATASDGTESDYSNIVLFDNRTNASFSTNTPTLRTLHFATNHATLDWSDNVSGAFVIERSRDGTNWESTETIADTNKTVEAFRFAPTFYRVRRFDSNGISEPSNVLTNRQFKRLVVIR